MSIYVGENVVLDIYLYRKYYKILCWNSMYIDVVQNVI